MQCLFSCFSMLGMRDYTLAKVAFFPPTPSRYQVIKEIKKEDKTIITYKLLLTNNQGMSFVIADSSEYISTVFLPKLGNFTIPLALLSPRNIKNPFVILYCHGNSTDIGGAYSFIAQLAETFGMPIFAFEYPGYGPYRQARPSDFGLMCFAECVLNFMDKSLHIDMNRVILYGESIGSGPSLYIGGRFPIKGIILNSAFAAGSLIKSKIDLKKKKPNKPLFYEIFPNIELIKNVPCPIFIIHGEKDTIAPVSHAHLLYNASNKLYPPLICKECGHCQIEHKLKDLFTAEMEKFFQFLINFNSQLFSPLLENPFSAFKHKYSKTSPMEKFTKENKIRDRTLMYHVDSFSSSMNEPILNLIKIPSNNQGNFEVEAEKNLITEKKNYEIILDETTSQIQFKYFTLIQINL